MAEAVTLANSLHRRFTRGIGDINEYIETEHYLGQL